MVYSDLSGLCPTGPFFPASEEHIPTAVREYFACARDPVHFLRNHAKLAHPIRGAIPFAPYSYQEQLIYLFKQHRCVFALTDRQMGKTACAAGFLLWKAVFTPGTSIAIVCNNRYGAHDVMGRIRQMYESTPDFLRPDLVAYNKGDIQFANGSRITACAPGSTNLRGRTVSLLYLDEMALFDDASLSEVWSSFAPCLASTEGSCIITTSPGAAGSGAHKLWIDAFAGENAFYPVDMSQNPHPYRNDDWAAWKHEAMGKTSLQKADGCHFS